MDSTLFEKILRRIEVRRLYQDPGSVYTADELAEISMHFIHYATETKDWRYLNAALKLNDWLRVNSHRHIFQLTQVEAAGLAELYKCCNIILKSPTQSALL